MNAAQLDAIRRIAEVNAMIAQQEVFKSELEIKRRPVEGINNVIAALKGCRCVIEASMSVDKQSPIASNSGGDLACGDLIRMLAAARAAP